MADEYDYTSMWGGSFTPPRVGDEDGGVYILEDRRLAGGGKIYDDSTRLSYVDEAGGPGCGPGPRARREGFHPGGYPAGGPGGHSDVRPIDPPVRRRRHRGRGGRGDRDDSDDSDASDDDDHRDRRRGRGRRCGGWGGWADAKNSTDFIMRVVLMLIIVVVTAWIASSIAVSRAVENLRREMSAVMVVGMASTRARESAAPS